jgi:adenosylcobinamide kinase / adenosylcobinamide-phosphate guanylyltransferase
MLTLIIGGARSGKSDLALRMAAASGRDVLFVATMRPADDETHARVEAHRRERPARWRTVEEPLDVGGAVAAHARPGDFVLIDCLTLWLSNMLLVAFGDDADPPHARTQSATQDALARVSTLLDRARAFDGDVTLVSNEVGQGVVPAHALGRVFRDALGAANRLIAADADRVYLVVAGVALDLRALGAAPVEQFGEAPRA